MRRYIIAGIAAGLAMAASPSLQANEPAKDLKRAPPAAAQPVMETTSTPLPVPSELLTAEEALRHLESKDPLEREKGLYELGALKSKDHLPRITAALADNHLDVRRAAIIALRLTQGQDAIPQLEQLATTARKPEMREQALHELQALQAPKTLPTMVRAWKKDHARTVRLAALEAMSATNDAAAVPYLVRALKQRNAEMRRSAAIGLGNLKTLAAPAVPQLIKRLERDGDENVRYDAAEALYRIGDARAVPTLLKALSDPADHVRVPAFKALDAWAQPGMEALIAPHLNYGRPHVRVYAARLLSKIGTETALTLLKARLARESHERVKPILVDAVHAVERKTGHAS